MKSSPRRIALSLADALFEIEGPERAERLGAVVDESFEHLRSASFVSRIGLSAALVLLGFAPLLFFFSWRPLDRLDRTRRREMLVRLERSPLGLVLVAWRTMLMLHFYEDARELARIGYREERKRHLQVIPAVIPAAAISGVRLREDIDVANDADAEVEEEKGAA